MDNKEQKPALTVKEIYLKWQQYALDNFPISENDNWVIKAMEEYAAQFAHPEATYLDKEKKSLIKELKYKIKECTDKDDEISWGMQEGILISKGFAKKVLEAICQLAVPEKNEGIRMSDEIIKLRNALQRVKDLEPLLQYSNEGVKPENEGEAIAVANMFQDINTILSSNTIVVEPNEEVKRLKKLINNPELENFIEGMKIESAHQTEKWGTEQEESNPPHHYTMVLNKLLGKMCVAIWDRNIEKFKHHCITMAAACHNVHRQIEKKETVTNVWFYPNSKSE